MVKGVAVRGNYAYLTDDYLEFQIVDVSDLSDIRQLGRYKPSGHFGGGGVVGLSENFAFVPAYANDVVEVVDISDPTDPTMTTVKDMAVGRYHTCALMYDGTIKCWGRNVDGRLGNGSKTTSGTPVEVVGIDNAVAIAAGEYHSCAVLETGGVKCWGEGQNGQLGIGYFSSDQTTPVDVVNIDNAVAIAAGFRHTCIIDSEKDVWCWGYNGYGQLGDGSTTSERDSPVKVTGLTSRATVITAGGDHTCVIDNWRAKCWGNNSQGQLGDNSTTNRHTPVDVVNGYSMDDISAGRIHTCAVKNEQAQCWGSGSDGRLGNGSTSQSLTPVDVTDGSNVEKIVAGDNHTCAEYSINGWFRCWGDNWLGQLGDGTRTDRNTPVDVVGARWSGIWNIDIIDFGGGERHSCAATSTGVKCWGYRGHGALGDGNIDGQAILEPIDALDMPIGQLDLGDGGSGPESVVIKDNYAYVVAGSDGLFILDISNPTQAKVLSNFTGGADSSGTHYWVNAVVISDDARYAYIAKSWEGVVVVDISDKNHPYQVGKYQTIGASLSGISRSGDYVYAVDSRGGVWLIDVINPRYPSKVQSYHRDMKYLAVVASGNDAYIAAQEDGVRVAHSDLREATESVTACDTFGHCVTKAITETNQLRLLALAAPTVAVSLMDDVDAVLDNTDPLTLTASVQSLEYLQSITATVNGAPLYSDSWPVTDAITTTRFSFGWTPAGEGEYLLDITARDWLTNTASYTQTVTIDTIAPAISIATDVLTSTHHAPTGEMVLTGNVTDANLNYIDVTISGGFDSITGRAEADGQAWTYVWETNQAAPLDNLAYTIAVTATDVAGWQTSANRDITVDVVAPQPVALSLSSAQHPVTHSYHRPSASSRPR